MRPSLSGNFKRKTQKPDSPTRHKSQTGPAERKQEGETEGRKSWTEQQQFSPLAKSEKRTQTDMPRIMRISDYSQVSNVSVKNIWNKKQCKRPFFNFGPAVIEKSRQS